jgi:hypothetical protein
LQKVEKVVLLNPAAAKVALEFAFRRRDRGEFADGLVRAALSGAWGADAGGAGG